METTPLHRSHADTHVTKLLNLLGDLENSDRKEIREIMSVAQDLKAHLRANEEKVLANERRVNDLLEVLIRYTVMDFSQKAQVTSSGDDLDAIAVGINTLADELNEKIREATEHAAQLKEQNQALDRINKELASFAYISSHDLQEPLRKINTYISRIDDEGMGDLPEQTRFYLERIKVAATRMQKLIRDILEYSRLSNKHEEVETISLKKLAEECREDFEEALKENNASLKIDNLPDARIVDFQFKRVLNNLISNSLKFRDPERPLVIEIASQIQKGRKLSELNLSPDEEYCEITFQDNGIGFETEYNEKIFEVFQRLHDQTQYQGTGVGLAICKKIIENHGGVIRAAGEPGKGARFEIYLPMP